MLVANSAIAQSLPVSVVDSCAPVQQAQPAQYVKRTALYETTVDGQTEYLDLYTPLGAINPPMAVVIHGGGFVGGDKATGNALPLSLGLVSLGWEVASINYRLSGANGLANFFPAPLQDALCALQWVKTNGGGDTDHTIVAGMSAGGGIADWVGTIGQQTNAAWHSPTCSYTADTPQVAGIAAFYGFSDFVDPAVHSSAATLDRWDLRVFGFTPATSAATLTANLPVDNVAASEPPFFIASGLADTVIYPAQVANFATALQNAGVPTNIVQEAGVGHAFAPFNSSLGPIPCTFVAWLNAVRLR